MRQYFANEIRKLHDAGTNFAKVNPAQASKLNLAELQDKDPHVERLLEGVAFLTGQVQQRLDDGIPELSSALIEQFWPQLMRPMPSATIIKFDTNSPGLQATQVIEKQSSLLSNPVGNDSDRNTCDFRTTSKVKLQPLKIQKLTQDETERGNTIIELHFELDSDVPLSALDIAELPLYLQADTVIATQLYYVLTTQVEQMMVTTTPDYENRTVKLGGQNHLQAMNLSTQDSLRPLCGRSFPGFSLLQDYFCFRDKFLFVKLLGLQGLSLPEETRQFCIKIELKTPWPAELRLRKSCFQLYCTPAINLFDYHSEAVPLAAGQLEYPLLADASHASSIQLYQVQKVSGATDSDRIQVQFEPLASFQHLKNNAYYTTRAQDLGAEFPATFISPSSDELTEIHTLSCDLLATNGHYPRRYLTENALTQLAGDTEGVIKPRNLARPTQMLMPPEHEHLAWLYLSHLSLNYRTLTDASTFQDILCSYDWSNKNENHRRIKAIQSLQYKVTQSVRRGALMHGLEFTLDIQESGFAGLGDLYLFGTVIHQFLSYLAPFNYTVDTIVHCHPTNKELKWGSLFGKQTIL